MQMVTVSMMCFQLAMDKGEVKKHHILKNVLLYLFFWEIAHYSWVIYMEPDT